MRDPFAARLALSRSALDRDGPARDRDGRFDELLRDPGTRYIVLHRDRAAHSAAERLLYLTRPEVDGLDPLAYLGRSTVDDPRLARGTPIVAVVADDEQRGRFAAEWTSLRRSGVLLNDLDAGVYTQALALKNWHDAARFSPRTGGLTTTHRSGWVRLDPETGTQHFPRTDPAIIVGVTDADDRLLLGSNALWEPNRFSILAGFVEPGESLEAAVIREVFEESGLRVVDPVYLGSQPWPFPASLMLGFTARLAHDTATEPAPDGDEIAELRWFTRDELLDSLGDIVLPGPTSIARAIIERWLGHPLEIPDDW